MSTLLCHRTVAAGRAAKVTGRAGVILFVIVASALLASCSEVFLPPSPTPPPAPTFAPSPTPQSTQAITMITEPWDPWIVAPEGEAPSGIFIEITQEICRRGKLQCQFEFYPWNRCLHKIELGESDVLLMLEKTAEREEFMVFSEPLFEDLSLVYYRVEGLPDFQWNAWEDLRPYRIGITSGYTYGDEFEQAKAGQGYQFDEATSDAQTITKLVAGRFDIAFLNKTIAEKYLREHPELAGQIKAAGKPVTNSSYYITFSKKSKHLDLLPAINAIIREMKDDGTMNRLLYE